MRRPKITTPHIIKSVGFDFVPEKTTPEKRTWHLFGSTFRICIYRFCRFVEDRQDCGATYVSPAEKKDLAPFSATRKAGTDRLSLSILWVSSMSARLFACIEL